MCIYVHSCCMIRAHTFLKKVKMVFLLSRLLINHAIISLHNSLRSSLNHSRATHTKISKHVNHKCWALLTGSLTSLFLQFGAQLAMCLNIVFGESSWAAYNHCLTFLMPTIAYQVAFGYTYGPWSYTWSKHPPFPGPTTKALARPSNAMLTVFQSVILSEYSLLCAS